MGHGPLAVVTLGLALVAPITAKASRGLQEGTAGTCLYVASISGESLNTGQDAESLQVGAFNLFVQVSFVTVGDCNRL